MRVKLALVVPPPVVLLGHLGWVYACHLYAWAVPLPSISQTAMWAWIGLGCGFGLLGAIALRRAHTTIHPVNPERTSQLVVTGIYRFSRNPMYLGMATILSGVVLYKCNWLSIAAVPSFIGYMTQFQIKPEERAIQQKFPQAYQNYRQRTRRWI